MLPGAPTPADETLAALGLRPVAPRHDEGTARSLGTRAADPVRVAAEHELAPLLLVAEGSVSHSEEEPGHGLTGPTHLVSAAGALGWRPPLERLYAHATLGARVRRLRFLLDAVEHHAARAADCYAASALVARRTAALFDTHALTTLTGQTALYVELDALHAAVQRTYAAAGRLLAEAFPPRGARSSPAADEPGTPFDALVLGARGAPGELRETHASAVRRALRARDAAQLGCAPVRVERLACAVWAVRVPVRLPNDDSAPRRRADALDVAWAIATDAMRAVSLVVYAAAEK